MKFLIDQCQVVVQNKDVVEAGNLENEKNCLDDIVVIEQQGETIQENDGTYFQISELRKNMNEKDKFIIVKIIRKPEDPKLYNISDYFVVAKDNSGTIQLVFIKQRLQESFDNFYDQLVLQNSYRIQDFDVGIYNSKTEIKIKKSTKIILIRESEPQYIVSRLIDSDFKEEEELNLVGMIQQIDYYNPISKFRQGTLATGKPNSKEPLLIGFTLWDQHISLELQAGDILVMEFVILKKLGDKFEIKSTKTKMNIIKKNILHHKQYIKAWNFVEFYAKYWLQAQQMIQEMAEELKTMNMNAFVDIEQIQLPYQERFNAVLRVVATQLPKFSTKNQKLTRLIEVQYNNVMSPINMLLYGPICNCVQLDQVDRILVFEDIAIKQYNGQKELVTYDGSTKIRLAEEYEGTEQWDFVKSSIEKLNKITVKKEDSVYGNSQQKKTIKIKVRLNSGQNILNQVVFPYITLDKVEEEVLDRFHILALVQEVHSPIKLQTKYGEQLRRDIYLSDEFKQNVPLTLWNKQAKSEIKVGTVVIFESLCYDRNFKELKTVHNESQIIENLCDLSSEQQNRATTLMKMYSQTKSQMNEYEWKHLLEIFQLQSEKNDLKNEYYYGRGQVVDIFLGKIQPKCPQCFNQTLIQEDQSFVCMNGERKHLVEFPKFSCFTRARLADGTCNVEAILSDDVLEEFLNQKTLQEAYHLNNIPKNHFEKILFRDVTFKIQILKTKPKNSSMSVQEEDQRRIKIHRLLHTQAIKENHRLLQELIK